VARVFVGKGLPATDGEIDEPGISFQRAGMSSAPLCSNDGSAQARKGIEDNVALFRAVLDGINDERDRLRGGVDAGCGNF